MPSRAHCKGGGHWLGWTAPQGRAWAFPLARAWGWDAAASPWALRELRAHHTCTRTRQCSKTRRQLVRLRTGQSWCVACAAAGARVARPPRAAGCTARRPSVLTAPQDTQASCCPEAAAVWSVASRGERRSSVALSGAVAEAMSGSASASAPSAAGGHPCGTQGPGAHGCAVWGLQAAGCAARGRGGGKGGARALPAMASSTAPSAARRAMLMLRS